jgi:hypothetical protein
MPNPWSPDATKDATLSQLASSLNPGFGIHCETAYALVAGDPGFTGSDSYDDLCYVRFNWARFAPATTPAVGK